jgi:hypothetical protein
MNGLVGVYTIFIFKFSLIMKESEQVHTLRRRNNWDIFQNVKCFIFPPPDGSVALESNKTRPAFIKHLEC